MKAVVAGIQSGAFAPHFLDDQNNCAKEFLKLRKKGEGHLIESTGRELRQLFSWVAAEGHHVDGSARLVTTDSIGQVPTRISRRGWTLSIPSDLLSEVTDISSVADLA